MKLNRLDLKDLVKECLVEILAEGLSLSSLQINESKNTNKQNHSLIQATSQNNQAQTRVHPSNNMSFLPRNTNNISEEKLHKNNLVMAAKSISSNPMIAEMLAETAMRSSQSSMNESTSGIPTHEQAIMNHGDSASKKMLMSDPTDIFSDSASKWASLAFAEKKVGV